MAPSKATPDDGWEDNWTPRTVRKYPERAVDVIRNAATFMRSLESERDALAAVIEAAQIEADRLHKWIEGNPSLVLREKGLEVSQRMQDALTATPTPSLAAHDAKVLRDAADELEAHWAPDTAEGEEIAEGSVALIRSRAARIGGGTL